MGLCVFCSSVFFCEKKNIGDSLGRFSSHREDISLLLNLAMIFGKDESSYDDKKILHCFKRDSF